MLIDSATIHVRSGKGGDGVVAFRRLKYIPKGGPSGGDGGNGGDVILEATAGVDTLLDFTGRHHWHGEDGEAGRAKQQHGKDGRDLVIRVPVGTLVYDQTPQPDDADDQKPSETDAAETSNEAPDAPEPSSVAGAPSLGTASPERSPAKPRLLIDLKEAGQRYVVAGGGRGGFGNEHFKSPTHQTPREFKPGEPAVERMLRLELKLIADVGLVGKPNAGKSTLLSVVSRATPKVADYPFTTLSPNLGIAELARPGRGGDPRRLVVEDIPGLIEHASEGAGLGIRFLRHIERTRLLVHLIEASPQDGSDPLANYRGIRRELERYESDLDLGGAAEGEAETQESGRPANRTPLAEKPELIVLSKVDVLGGEEEVAAAVAALEAELGRPVLAISSATRVGLDLLLEACWTRTRTEEEPADAPPATPGWGG